MGDGKNVTHFFMPLRAVSNNFYFFISASFLNFTIITIFIYFACISLSNTSAIMKKPLLFTMAITMAITSYAQQAQREMIFTPERAYGDHSQSLKPVPIPRTQKRSSNTARTTSAICTSCGRWYDYVDDIVATNAHLRHPLAFTPIDIWNDTTAIFGYTDTTAAYHNTDFTSVGLNFDPWAWGWPDTISGATASTIAISPIDAYSVDSIKIGGVYQRNPAKPEVVDTLIVQFVYGDGSTTSNLPFGIQFDGAITPLLTDYGLPVGDSIPFMSMLFDSLDDRAGASGGPVNIPYPVAQRVATPAVLKFPLTTRDTVTSSIVGNLAIAYPRSGHAPADPVIDIAVPAGCYMGASVSFKSGDTAVHGIYPIDTVRYSTGTAITGYKYNVWSPLIAYEGDGTADGMPNFPPYENTPLGNDWTSGYFNREGATGLGDQAYVPNWGWVGASDTDASILQYPYIWFHIRCVTCDTVGSIPLASSVPTAIYKVTAFPNPASDQLTIAYTLENSAVATITLRNMLGQVVASQQTTNSATGNVTFNTGKLPDGIYIYTFEANGERTTGRVVVAH